MRNYLTLVLGVMIISSSAFASRARLESLGEGKNGSFFIDDSRNMFYNPAFVNNYKKKLMLELGANTGTVANSADSTAASKAEGGFTNTFGDFAYGLYLGHESDRTENALATLSKFNQSLGGPGTSFAGPNNAIDFFFGGDAGVKWGVNVFYAGSENKIAKGMDQTASELGFRLGVIAGQLQAFATIGAMDHAKGDSNALATDEVKGKFTMDLGAAYSINDMHTVFAKFTTNGFEYDAGTPSAKVAEGTNMTIEAGLGCKKDVTKNTNVFSRFELMYGSTKISQVGPPTSDSTAKMWNVPLSLGAETAALSWLTVRGSVAESLLGQNLGSDGARTTMFNSTTVAAGLGLTFGDIQIDGLVATTGGTNNFNNNGTAGGAVTSNASTGGSGTAGTASWGFGSNMLTRIGMTYNF